MPAQFVAAAPSAFVRFIAYGVEANFAHPPRPKDPKIAWNPDWAVKVRLKSTAAAMLGEEGGDASGWLLGNEWDSVMNYRFRSAVFAPSVGA